MHGFLRSIGFLSWTGKDKLKTLTDWVLRQPDRLSIVQNGPEGNLAMAEREVAGHAGVAVVGEIDERGDLVPEYYFPYLNSSHISSDARLSYDRQSSKNGYIGMCEDFRMGMSLIFTVKNVTETMKQEAQDGRVPAFRRVALSALAHDGMVLLPMMEPQKVLKSRRKEMEQRARLLEEARAGSQEALDALTLFDMRDYQQVLRHLDDTDIFSMVESFFMPYGMESDQYYFMGRILTVQLLTNPLSDERFYRMLVESNGMEVMVAVNEADLTGVPSPGCRLKCKAWLMGEMKY